MTIHGKIGFKEVIIVDEKLLKNLEAVILSFFRKKLFMFYRRVGVWGI